MKKIVVAEDDPGIQDVLQLILKSEGYEVKVFPRGEDLLEEKVNLPDLFLLDKKLAGMDGLDICRLLKNQASTSHIPVVILSANPDIAELYRSAGADDYLEKPFTIQMLRDIVLKYA